MARESPTKRIALLIARRFPSLSTSGTDIQRLVSFVLMKRNALERLRLQKIGNDARDYINTAYFLGRLSKKNLVAASRLQRSEIRRRLKTGASPFLRLSKEGRETLLHLPTSWVYRSANWLLQSRQSH